MCERGKADLYKDGPRTTRRELLLPTKFPQPFIAYSEVVTNLVDYGPSHRDHDLFLGLAAAADWILVDGDAIRNFPRGSVGLQVRKGLTLATLVSDI